MWHVLDAPAARATYNGALDMQISRTRAAKRCIFVPDSLIVPIRLMSCVSVRALIIYLFVSFRGCSVTFWHTLNCFPCISICSARRPRRHCLSRQSAAVPRSLALTESEWVSDSQPSDDYATCIAKSVMHAPKDFIISADALAQLHAHKVTGLLIFISLSIPQLISCRDFQTF